MNQRFTTARILTMLAAAALILGAMGPWITLTGLSIAGTSGNLDGHLTALVGIVALAALGFFRERIIAVLVIAGGIVATLLALNQVSKINDTQAFSVGWGLWLTLIAAIALVIGCVVLMREREVKPVEKGVQQS